MGFSMKRCIHIDFHTMPGVKDFAKEIDAARIADMFSSAHVTWVNLFARCNIGFSYYPTKVGIPYPGLQRDLLGELIEACHKKCIGVTAYLNIDLDHELFRLHPEYCRVNQDGSIIEQSIVGNNFYRSGCLNGAYRDHLLAEIREILESGNRTAAGPTVPPGGLYMTHLWYDDGNEKFEVENPITF